MYEVWGEGNSKEELIEAVSSYPEERKAPYLAKDHTFKIVVDRFGKVLSSSEQKACIESIDYVPFQVYTLLYFCFFLMLFFFKIARGGWRFLNSHELFCFSCTLLLCSSSLLS
jgi:hypothetical protein